MRRTTSKTTGQRGYGGQHKRLRKQFEPLVAAGQAYCWRCLANGVPNEQARIRADEPWDLGHDDNDRTQYRGPEHAKKCNRAAAGRKAAANRKARQRPTADNTRQW